MSRMNVSAWGHACIRLEKDGGSLVIDPGTMSDLTVLDDAGAVLITHVHADHVAVAGVAAALGRAGLETWAPQDVVEQLIAAGASADRVHATADGDAFVAGGFDVRAVGRDHAVVHPSLPRATNVAFLVERTAFHPGDSFTPPPDGQRPLALLFLPVSAPWLKLAESVDYLAALAPRTGVPIHDGVLNDAGKALVDRVVTGLAGSVTYRRLAPGETLEAPAG
jgi:L-ascorbate metabolism protein UlaG (beta-lactamase superfamily)